MSVSTKIVLVAMSLTVAYFAVWLGDTGASVYFAGGGMKGGQDNLLAVSALFIGVFNGVVMIGVIAAVIVGMFMAADSENEGFELTSLAGFVGAAYLLGAFAAPITSNHSYAVWDWADGWTFLSVIAFAPVAIIIKDIVLDLFQRRHSRNDSASVTRLRR